MLQTDIDMTDIEVNARRLRAKYLREIFRRRNR